MITDSNCEVLRTAIGASVFVITALATYVLRTGNFLPSDIFRKQIVFSVTILTCSAFGSLYSIIKGLGWLKMSQSIAKGKDSEIVYYENNVNILNNFLDQIKAVSYFSKNLADGKLFAYENIITEEAIEEQKKNLTILSEICRVTNVALYKKAVTPSSDLEIIKIGLEKLDIIKNNLKDIKNKCDWLLNFHSKSEAEISDQDNEKKLNEINKQINKINSNFKIEFLFIQEYCNHIERS